MVTTVIIVRHCQSMGNTEGRFQGRFDADVTPVGEQQMELLSLRFRNEKLDALYTSPLLRARRTAEAVNRYHQLQLQICEGLSELDVGKLENRKLSEIGELFPETAKNWDQSPDLCEFPGGETMKQAYRRVNQALDWILEENRGKTVMAVTHGGVIRNLYARVCAGCPEGIRQSAVFGNTGVSVLEADEAGRLSWTLLNDLSHLPEELRRSPIKYSFHGEAV